jgi:hypothetical protein
MGTGSRQHSFTVVMSLMARLDRELLAPGFFSWHSLQSWLSLPAAHKEHWSAAIVALLNIEAPGSVIGGEYLRFPTISGVFLPRRKDQSGSIVCNATVYTKHHACKPLLQAVLDLAARMLGLTPLQTIDAAPIKVAHGSTTPRSDGAVSCSASKPLMDSAEAAANSSLDDQIRPGCPQRTAMADWPEEGLNGDSSSNRARNGAVSPRYGAVSPHWAKEPQHQECRFASSQALDGHSGTNSGLISRPSELPEALLAEEPLFSGDAGLDVDQPQLAERRRLAEALLAVSKTPASWLRPVLAAIVSSSSKRQALAGLIATGPWKSLVYVSHKVHKRLRDWFH